MDFLEGDRVLLKEGYFAPMNSNPCIGSEWECTGTVVEIIEDEDAIIVEWDNQYENTYQEEQLIRYQPLPQDNPNRAFTDHQIREFVKGRKEEAERRAKERAKKKEEKKASYFEQYAATYFEGDAER